MISFSGVENIKGASDSQSRPKMTRDVFSVEDDHDDLQWNKRVKHGSRSKCKTT
ncbi:predicted protein [Botrytis cinerea T4]|uniref:Uncharacterized protein n=1 Tax=Botryotinia fuckeliana (strain T4) TaxID=999810 RepID=G2XW29_BOTF4|nr:predicted protein [Botrytis cinerea T4]